jgi:hypothetical protein
MSAKKTQNAKFVPVTDYFSPETLRVITPEQLAYPLGYSEHLVEIEVSDGFARHLSFKPSWDRKIYACTHGVENLDGLLSEFLDDGKTNKSKIFLYDEEDRFLLLLISRDGDKSLSFHLKTEEVLDLLRNCRRPL